MGKIIGTIATLGALYIVGLVGDTINLTDFHRKYVSPRGVAAQQQTIDVHITSLEQAIAQSSVQNLGIKDEVYTLFVHCPGELTEASKTQMVNQVVTYINREPKKYETEILEMVSKLEKSSNFEGRKKLYDIFSQDTKDALFKEYLIEKTDSYKLKTNEVLDDLWNSIVEQYARVKETFHEVFSQ